MRLGSDNTGPALPQVMEALARDSVGPCANRLMIVHGAGTGLLSPSAFADEPGSFEPWSSMP